jgi:hypothetical protein
MTKNAGCPCFLACSQKKQSGIAGECQRVEKFLMGHQQVLNTFDWCADLVSEI